MTSVPSEHLVLPLVGSSPIRLLCVLLVLRAGLVVLVSICVDFWKSFWVLCFFFFLLLSYDVIFS